MYSEFVSSFPQNKIIVVFPETLYYLIDSLNLNTGQEERAFGVLFPRLNLQRYNTKKKKDWFC